MSTQPYSPQGPGTPPPLAGKFAPAQGYPEIIAITAIPGSTAQSQIGPPEVKFRLLDGRAWYVPPAVADEIYRLRIAPNQRFEVAKTGRMKHELRITPIQSRINGNGAALTTPQPAARNQEQQHTNYPSPNRTADAGPLPTWDEEREQPAAPPERLYTAPSPSTPAPALTMAGRFSAADMIAIDTLLEAKAYAQRKGLALEIRCEDVRARSATIMIDQQKGGR